MSDPSYENIFFLANLNGADGAVNYTPDIGTADFTFHGSAQLDIAVKKFGTASMLCSGTNDYATHGSAGDYNFLHDNSTDWTIEFFVTRTAGTNTGLIDTTAVTGSPDVSGFTCYINSSDDIVATVSNATTLRGFTTEGSFPGSAMTYVAIVYEISVGAPRIYVDAVTSATPSVLPGSPSTSNSQPLHLGRYTNVTSYDLNGHMDSVRISKEALSITSVPTVEFSATPPASGLVEGVLDTVGLSGYGYSDLSGLLAGASAKFVMDIVGTTTLRIPISSWQGTLSSGIPGYLQAVIPNSAQYESEIATRLGNGESFKIYRLAENNGQTIEVPVMESVLDNVSTYRGPFRASVVLAGYPTYSGTSSATRTMTNIRTWSSNSSGKYRARCDIDYYLNPGDIADVDGYQFTVDYINYYAPTSGDIYMDIGAR